ncbi:hypothetical protein ACFLZ4_01895 [Patescibacteria group bacterium]
MTKDRCYKINEPKNIKNNTLMFSITFETTLSPITIKGFRVQESKNFEGPWVQPPTVNIYGKYIPTVFLESKKGWKILEEELAKEYQKYYEDSEEISQEDLDSISEKIN